MVTEEIRKIIQEFAKRVSEWGIRIDKVILYGSYAKGCAHKFSDIDVAIISPDFGKNRLEERSMLSAWQLRLMCAWSRLASLPGHLRRIPGFRLFMR